MISRAARRGWIVTALLLVGAFAVLVPTQMALDRRLVAYRQTPEMLWMPSGKILRALSLGHNGLLGHIYWTRAVQYFGRQRILRKFEYPLLAPLLDITVALDPQLIVAYRFGGVFLSAPPPYGAGEPEKAIALLRRGIEANPDYWRFWHDLAFIYYWELKDYPAASAAYLEGSKNPDAAPWVKVMAAVIEQKGGDRETSRFLWAEIYNSTEDVTIRENARMHLDTLRALDDIDELERRAAAFRDRTGRWPQSFQELTAAGLLEGVPLDPQGHPYRLQPDGKIALDPQSTVKLDYGPSPGTLPGSLP
jgi:tetratricopeptide (TPR) repeat protein